MNANEIARIFILDNPEVDLEGQRAHVTLQDVSDFCFKTYVRQPASSTMERALRIIKAGK